MNPQELRRIFGFLATGVTVVTAIGPQGEPVGVTANSVTSVSLDPPLILWCLTTKNINLSAFALHAPFSVNVLTEQQTEIAKNFARSGTTKFRADTYSRNTSQPPTISDALARIVCRVVALHLAGDHTIIVGSVDSFESREGSPLVFQSSRFGRFLPAQASADAFDPLLDVWM
ncbi:MAG: flavin reductase [Gammaproteobacteria bacterium]|nr:flavin reductase [Gammaproteobacteria bacterium]